MAVPVAGGDAGVVCARRRSREGRGVVLRLAHSEGGESLVQVTQNEAFLVPDVQGGGECEWWYSST